MAREVPNAIKAVFKPQPASCNPIDDDDACSDYKAAVSAVPANRCMAGTILRLVNMACIQHRSRCTAISLTTDAH